jgi:hypothetical protein
MDLDSTINEISVRDALEKLSVLYADLPTTLLGLMHINKKGDQKAIDRISGTLAFTNFNRGALTIAREKPSKADQEAGVNLNRFRITHPKHNLTPWGAAGNDLIGDIFNTREKEDPRGQHLAIKWSKAEENIDPDNAFDSKPEEKGDEGQTIRGWLAEYLTANGPTDTDAIKLEAAKRGWDWESVVKVRYRHRKIFATEDIGGYPNKTLWRLI